MILCWYDFCICYYFPERLEMSDGDDDLGDWEMQLVYTRLLRLGTLQWARSVDRYTDYADSAV